MELKDIPPDFILDNLYDGLYFVDLNRRIIFWNKAAERISGFTKEEVLGRPCSDNILTHIDAEGNSLCLGMCPLAETMIDGKSREAEVYMHHKDGHRIPVSIRTSVLIDKDGNTVGGIELFTDISHQAANALRVKELEKLALLDHLTQLANRTYLERELHSRLEEKKRYNMSFGVLFMDIDHFKHFNDTYGHDVGDEVLKLVARTLISSTRPFDLFGRWGGEEFLGIIRNVDSNGLEAVGKRILTLVEHAYFIHEKEKLSVTLSIGATLANKDDTMDDLVKRADHLMYQSKQAGRNRLTLQ